MMSRYLKQYEKEHMKMAMLKQEETFKQQVQELHRLYRVQKLLMAGTASSTMPAAIACRPEEEDEAAGSSRPWDAYPTASTKAPPPLPPLALEESDLDLTLALGGFGTPEKTTAAKKEALPSSSSVDSRTSISTSSSTESGSPHCRAPPRPSHSHPAVQAGVKPNAGAQRLEQEALKQQPPWLHQCLSLAR